MSELTQDTLRDASPVQIMEWFLQTFKKRTHLHNDGLRDVIDAIEAQTRPVVRYWDVRWIRAKGYYKAEVSNYLMRNYQYKGGRQGFGWGDTPSEALMEAALDWYLRVQDERKQEQTP